MRGTSPGPSPPSTSPPSDNKEYVFPDPVCPYAITHPRMPPATASNTGAHVALYTSRCVAFSSKAPSTANARVTPFTDVVVFTRTTRESSTHAPPHLAPRASSSRTSASSARVSAASSSRASPPPASPPFARARGRIRAYTPTRAPPCTIPRAFPRVPATDATRNRTPELFPSRARARACATIPLPVDRRRAIRVPNSTDHDSYPRVTTDRFQGLASRARSVPSCPYIPSPHSDNVFIVHTQEPLSNTKTRQSKRKALVARDDADAMTLARAMRMDDRRRRRKTTDDRRPMATTMRGA